MTSRASISLCGSLAFSSSRCCLEVACSATFHGLKIVSTN
jgi:hypothetical protein